MAVRWDAAADALSRTTTLPTITSFTMMGWFLVSVDKDASTAFLTLGHATTTDLSYQIGTSSTGTTFQLDAGNQFTNGAVLSVTTWYHVAVTVAGTGAGQALAYLNGVLNITHGSSFVGIPAGKLWVGNGPDANYLNGRACAIKVWNAVLTPEEIRNEMRQMQPVRVANLNTWSPLLSHLDLANYAGTGDWVVGGTLTTEAGPPIVFDQRPRGHIFVPAALGTTRNLSASLLATTQAPAALATQSRGLSSALLSATGTPPALVTQARTVVGTLIISTQTPAAVAVLGTQRALVASLTGQSQTPTAVPTQARQLSAGVVSASLTAPAAQALTRGLSASLGVSSQTPSALNVRVPFTNATPPSLVILGTTHSLGHRFLRVQVYDDATPRRRLFPGGIHVHTTTFDVTVPLLQAQSGLVVINGYQPDPGPQGNKGFPFTPATTWSITGAEHGYGTDALLIDVYDDSTPRVWLPFADVSVHPTTFEITVSWLQAQRGLVVVGAYSSVGTPNLGVTLTGGTSQTILGTTHGRGTALLGLQVYDATGTEVIPGTATVHPTSYDVALAFLQGQGGTVVLHGSYAVAPSLVAGLLAVSATPSSVVTTLRRLAANLSPSSVTATASATLATLRALSAILGAASTTPASVMQVARLLTVQAAGTSLTSSVAVTTGRACSVSLSASSQTATAVATMGTLRSLSATLTASSQTPSALVTQVRRLAASFASSSQTATTTATMGTLRLCAAALSAQSQTPTSLATQVRRLLATLTAQSQTAAAGLTTVRRLSASLLPQSQTRTATGTLAALVACNAAVLGQSQTTTAGVSHVRRLATALVVSSQAATASSSILRPLSASLATQSQTSAATSTSVTLVSLTAHPVGMSQTALAAARQARSLIAGMNISTQAPDADHTLLRQLRVLLQWQSQASTATGTLATLIAMVAHLSGQSQTPPADLLTARRLTTALLGVSQVPPGATTQARLLSAALSSRSQTALVTATQSGVIRYAAQFVVASQVGRATLYELTVWEGFFLRRVEYLTEIHFVNSQGHIVQIIRKRLPPTLQRYAPRW